MFPSTSRFLMPSASLCHTLQLRVFIVKYLQPFSGQALPKKTHKRPQEKDTRRKSTKFPVLPAKPWCLLNRVVSWCSPGWRSPGRLWREELVLRASLMMVTCTQCLNKALTSLLGVRGQSASQRSQDKKA